MSPDPRTAQPRQHTRSGSHGRKILPAHARPSKPPPLTRRGKSYDATHPSPLRPTSSSAKRLSTEEPSDLSDEEEMAGFLHFCTSCEKQIINPSPNILYCSEACRKRDSMPTPLSAASLTPLTPSTTSYFDHYPMTNIIPQRSPTVARPPSMGFPELSRLDLRQSSEESTNSPSSTHCVSDAARSLSQLYIDSPSATNARRHQANRSSTSNIESTVPSLIHSPSSSYSTIASNASYRPLPPRQNPFNSTFPTKSIDLVLPYYQQQPIESHSPRSIGAASMKSSASTVTSYRIAEANDISYHRRDSSRGSEQEEERLDRLYNHEAVKGGALPLN